MSSIDSPTSGPKGLNTHSLSEQPQPQKIFDPHQFATRRFHGHLEICCGYALVKDGVPLVFDGRKSVPSIAGAMRKLPCTSPKRKQKQFVLSPLTRSDSRSGQLLFPFAGGLGRARLRHFFLDSGTCRFVRFFRGFLGHRAFLMTSRRKQYSSL